MDEIDEVQNDARNTIEFIRRTIRENERHANQYLGMVMRRSTKEERDRDRRTNG